MNKLLAFLISSSFMIPLHLFGYANDGANGGPHRKINELALKAFIEKAAKDPILSKYDFAPSYEKYPFIGKTDKSGEPFMVESITVLKKGDWAEEDRLQNLAGYSYVTTKFKEGKAKGSFSWWLIEGGMTADEPESFMALRHFYDPKNQMSPGLTDLSDGWIEQTVLLMGENPKMNAMDWGLYASRYSLRDGAKIFKESETALLTEDKQKYLGMSWRCFGEAMHLFADMTVPAHVRNDGHPGIYGDKLSNWAGYFIKTLNVKSDPYEDYVTSSVVEWFAQSPAEDKIIKEIAAAKNPKALFEMTAIYTNEKFFSQDTISGQDQLTNVNFSNFNGRANYNLPDLGKAKLSKRDDTSVMYYTTQDSVGELFVCKRQNPNELSSPGEINAALSDPATIAKMHVIDKLVSQSQASRLIPVAVAANEKLLELTFPRVGVIVDGINRENKSLEAHVVTYQQNKDGAFDINTPQDLTGLPTSMPNVIVAVTVGKNTDYYWLPVSAVKGNIFQVNLEEIPGKTLAAYFESDPNNTPATEIKLVVGLEMGGILVKSDEYSPLGISIEPETAMINTNNSRLFKARIVGGKNQEIDWSIQEKDGGTVSSSGAYTAPGKAGTYHLTASSRLEPSKRAVATVYVSKSDDQPIQKDNQPAFDYMNMSWESLFKKQRMPDYLKFRSSGSRSEPEPKDGTAKYGFVFGMFDEGTGYGWYRILEKGLIKVIKDYNSNGKLDAGDIIEEKPYVVYYELTKDELNINVNRRSEYYGTDYFFLGSFMDEVKTKEDYKKEETSLIKPRSAGVGKISVMGLKENSSHYQKGVCWAAIEPFETKVQIDPMIQIKDYNRYHLTTGGIKMYQYGQMAIADKNAWDKKAVAWAEKSVTAAQEVAKEIVGEQQKFYDFCVNSFVYDARKIIIGPMGFKLKEPVKTDKPLIGWGMTLEGDYGHKDNRPWEKYYVNVSLRYPLLNKTGNELLTKMHEEMVRLSKSKWEGVSGQNAGIGDESVFFKLERQLKYGDDNIRISLKERIRLRSKNVFVEVTSEACYNPKDLQIVQKTKEIAGAVVAKIGSGGAIVPTLSQAEPQQQTEQQRAQTLPEPQQQTEQQRAQTLPEPQKTEQKTIYDNVKQINNDVKDAGNKVNKAYESLKSLF